jgi:hypothetical protein
MKTVTGSFHDEELAAKAIEGLVEAGVPVDEISVVVMDAGGAHEVPIQETTPVLKGGIAGGALGGVLGGVGAVLAATGVVVGPGAILLASGPVLAAIQGVVGGAGLGYGVGVLASLDYWKDEADLHAEDLEKGAALITVHSDDLHDVAREILRESGATRTSG